jgi:hypothetical protein
LLTLWFVSFICLFRISIHTLFNLFWFLVYSWYGSPYFLCSNRTDKPSLYINLIKQYFISVMPCLPSWIIWTESWIHWTYCN